MLAIFCVIVSVPPPRPSITGGAANGSVYGFGILLDAILDAVLARTVRSNGNAIAAAPSADTFSASRRDIDGTPMASPIPPLYFSVRRFAGRRGLDEPLVGGRCPQLRGMWLFEGVLSGPTGAAGARVDNVSKVGFTGRERCGPLPR